MSIALLIVGNEILDGSTTDSNSGWVCRQVSGRGATVVGAATVPDDASAISSAISYLMSLRPSLLITLGGLGPTRDDLTVSSVASYFKQDLVLHSAALKIVKRRYAELASEGRLSEQASAAAIEARDKMAHFPPDAVALDNKVGAAPGMWLSTGNTNILCLPGVPSELKYIFSEEAGALLESTMGTGFFQTVTLTTSTNDESELSQSLSKFDETASDLNVYLKSRARRFGSGVKMQVTISAKGNDNDDVKARIAAAKGIFVDILDQAGLAVEDEVANA